MRPRFVDVDYDVIQLTGGMDLATPTLSLPPGYARESVNFEASITGGYTRVSGYERFDGQPLPSTAVYATLEVSITGAIPVGSTIVGAVSGAQGRVIYSVGGDIAYSRASGTFQVGEGVLIAAVPQGTVTALAMSSMTARLAAQIQALAANDLRSDILAVPGSGPVRGVATLGSDVYAVRNDAGGTAAVIHRATSGGWSAVSLGFRLAFNNGTAEILPGDTVIGGTSGAQAVATRVVLSGGDWGTGDAVGLIHFASVTGTFQNGENLTVSAAIRAVSVGSQVANTLQPGGRYEFVTANFGGIGGMERLYGVSGVNQAFEFDGTSFLPIATGMAADAPQHVAAFKNHLFLSFGASLQHSGIGQPFAWSVVLGAGELLTLDPVTNLHLMPGSEGSGALAVFSRKGTSILYGTSSADWNLVNYEDSTGAIEATAQSVFDTYVLDDLGVMAISTTLNYGNFSSSSRTLNIQRWIDQRIATTRCSAVNRRRSQYRLFFGDGSGLYMTFANRKLVGAMPVEFPDVFFCSAEGLRSGRQAVYVGADNGFVYVLDSGTSFDGVSISASLPLVFNSVRSPRIRKRYRKAAFEVTGDGFAEFFASYQLGYSSTDIEQPQQRLYELPFSSVFWDEFTWDEFVWDGLNLAPAEIEVDGTAENISMQIASDGDFYPPFTINTIILHYTPRRGLR